MSEISIYFVNIYFVFHNYLNNNFNYLFADVVIQYQIILQKAPVLSRAALLLECCYFVHLCNRGGWDSISRPDLSPKKDLAMMLYKWGTAIGNKLGSIIAKENDAEMKRGEDLKRNETLERSILYEGMHN